MSLLRAIPYDMPIVGYGNHVVNTLRYGMQSRSRTFQLDEFDRGNYHKAVEQENLAKTDRGCALSRMITTIPEKSFG